MAKTSHSTSTSIAYATLRRAGSLSGRHARIWVWVKRLPAMTTQARSVQHHARRSFDTAAVAGEVPRITAGPRSVASRDLGGGGVSGQHSIDTEVILEIRISNLRLN